MGLVINLEKNNVGGNAKVLNNVRIADGATINIRENDIKGEIEALNDLQVDSIMTDLDKVIGTLNPESEEYGALRKLAGEKRFDRIKLREKLISHLEDFASGTLQNIVAHYLTGY